MSYPRISLIFCGDSASAPPPRALWSLINQSYPHWDLQILNCGLDGENLGRPAWSAVDRRIRVSSLPAEMGKGAALNLLAANASGKLFGYLEPDCELAPEYLERIATLPEPADVVVSAFDVVIHGVPGGPIVQSWDPAALRTQLFTRNIAKPFGVVHRRELFERAGGFHELLWGEEEWDLWKRFARLGAEFVFLKEKAGRFHLGEVRRTEESRARVALAPALSQGERETERRAGPTPAQRARIEEHRRREEPCFGTRSGWMFPKKVERVLFASVHCLLDYTNGASLAVLQALRWLNEHGFSAEAFCLCDHADPDRQHAGGAAGVRAQHAGDERVRDPFHGEIHEKNLAADDDPAVWSTWAAGIPVTVRQVAKNDPWRVTGDTRKFLAVYERLLARQRPDVVLTYGGDCLSMAMMEAAKFRDLPVVFWLHNFGYGHQTSFQFVDRVIVPSEFSRDYHWNRLGLDSCALPNFLDWNRVQVTDYQPRYVTFVNPEPVKGGFVFAAISRELAARRPDIPLLVVEGRTPTTALKQTGLDLTEYPNVTIHPRTADPREFYAVSKLVLMPSLWNESFGLVAVEAMINGIPVIASDRGALPEVVGDGGTLLNIPPRYTPATPEFPTSGDIEPWVTAITRLWDDAAAWNEASERARTRAELWRPEHVGPRFAEFFANVSPQPAPPLVPR